ncbi:peroxiredoxin [Luteimicrobium subarcticum]|uniref:Peroxiredoxin n=1 Tax=Luteimicrobium subarcticum TaxID=620910 RepID=A0A2M8WR53_9MICO|nr:peroxiredoxin [Luteimicrobium subarcticum]PJI93420.1 peroxiredoxin [Luteimicrobium subarcticum]
MTYGEVLRIGDPAPELGLPDVHGTPVTVASLRGAPALVVFVPFAFSRTCQSELSTLRDNRGPFDERHVRLVAVSCDSVFALRAWTEQEAFGFDLLSDFWPHGAAAQRYGVFDEHKGMAVRGSFLLDADGVVRWSVVNSPGHPRDLEVHVEALARL